MLLVAGGHTVPNPRLTDLLAAYRLERATTLVEARERCQNGHPDVVVLATDPTAKSTGNFITEIRAGRYDHPELPIVAVAGGEEAAPDGVDEVVAPPLTGKSLRTTVERALLLGEYKDAVTDYFSLCRERATGDHPRPTEYRAARAEADSARNAIVTHPVSISFERLLDTP